ncbi:MAG: serine/threonine protein kinase [Planctomycetes bacterium]|nr:serine/threonine protein kinase [Planctomycetota bacterium]
MLKARQKLGKYRIEQRLALGGFATVYKAMDTIEGIRVALKVPHTAVLNDRVLDDFRKEARLTARLEHPNIQPLKDASFIEGRFVIVTPLGDETLSDRLRRRMSLATALDLLEQMLEAVAYAHRQRVIHCDIKPENFLLFSGNRVRLTDFGISKVARKTIAASGSGTVGYMAPEQAMGRPSLRSDVFSLGLLLYRMLTGELPEWPYRWPPPAIQTLRRKVHPDLIAVIRRAVEVVPRRRYRDADRMLAAYKPARSKTLRRAAARRGLLGGTTSRRRRGRAS